MGNGCDSLFWLENWMGGGSLHVKFPRLFALENNKEVSLRDKIQNGILYGLRRSRGGGGGVRRCAFVRGIKIIRFDRFSRRAR